MTSTTIETGTFQTSHASKYLQQLCKHFGHKVPATFDEAAGQVDFMFGPAKMQAEPDFLRVEITLADPEDRDRARAVIDSHLERFAFREAFKTMDWQTQ